MQEYIPPFDLVLQNVRVSPAGFSYVGNPEFVRIDLESTVVRLADCTRVQKRQRRGIPVFFNGYFGVARRESLRLTSSSREQSALRGV
jgi:hypothetical protein